MVTLTTSQPATAVAFTSLKQNNKFVRLSFLMSHIHNFMTCRRYLAVGLESGGILIYSALSSSLEKWQLDITIDSR